MFEHFHLLAIGPTGWGDEILLGAWLTIRLAFATLPVGLALGFLVALAKRSESKLAARDSAKAFRPSSEGCRSFLRSSSSISAVSTCCRRSSASSPTRPSRRTDFSSGIIALGLVFAAYASEVFAAAFNAIPGGQWEGAKAVGLTGG